MLLVFLCLFTLTKLDEVEIASPGFELEKLRNSGKLREVLKVTQLGWLCDACGIHVWLCFGSKSMYFLLFCRAELNSNMAKPILFWERGGAVHHRIPSCVRADSSHARIILEPSTVYGMADWVAALWDAEIE